MSIQALIFVCAVGTAPSVCNVETAIRMESAPKTQNELMCITSAQTVMASKDWLPPRAGLEYMKVQCIRIDDRA